MTKLQLEESGRSFCDSVPHRDAPFAKRNWGGTVHSLCSYHGKLKPSIAHFLIANFTEPGDRVLDPLAGVGTIPLEARRQGRVAVANDLNVVAATVSRAKLLALDESRVHSTLNALDEAIGAGPPLSILTGRIDVTFGLNGPIQGYFESETLRELLIAREWFAQRPRPQAPEDALLMTCLLHILHGNRPYALSRRSHPVTPFAPAGDFEYRGLIERLGRRVNTVLPLLLELGQQPLASVHEGDFADLAMTQCDSVVTSPPFAKSVLFWSMNWMRLWFAGWDASDFAVEPKRFLEHRQRKDLTVYGEFARHARSWLRPGGRLILHLGETDKVNMASAIAPHLQAQGFEIAHIGRECVRDTESHGMTDKGSTVAHWYVFAERP